MQGELYVAGGTDGRMRRLRSVEKYSPERRQWSLLSPMIFPRSNFSMQVVEGAIMVCGGYDGTGVLSDAEVYNKEAYSWSWKMNIY
jgi:Kelch motif